MVSFWVDTALPWFVQATQRFGLNYEFLLDAYDRNSFLHGLLVTAEVCLTVIPLSLVFGVWLAVALKSKRRWLASLTRAFVELTRNTPTLVQLYCAFLVLNMVITHALNDHGGTNPLTPFIWVCLVVSIHKAAFHAEALRAGMEAVPATSVEAAQSLGFSARQYVWQIEIPLALRFALPTLINNLVDLVKMTAIASAIAVNDVTYASLMIWTQRDNVLELIILILLYFWLLTCLVSWAGRWLERRLKVPGYGQ